MRLAPRKHIVLTLRSWRARRAIVLVLLVLLALAPLRAHAQPAVQSEDATTFPIRVDEIRFTGLVRTKESFLRSEIGFHEGDVVTKDDFDLAVTRLWNTTIFAHVHGHVMREGKTIVLFELEDRWTLNPLLSFGSGGGAFFFRVGATDANIDGRFLEAYGLYENFDGFHGGLLMVRDPRLFGSRIDLSVQGDRLVRPRSGFSDQRTSGAIEVAALFARDRMRLGLRTSVFANRFLAPLETPPHYPAPTETLFLEPRFRIGRIDTVRIRQEGASLELRPGLGFTSSDVASEYVSLSGEVLAFAMPGERWNFALRARAATVSRVPEHLELYAGGLDLLRGFPDNFARTRALAFVNLEARWVAFDSTWVALIPAIFVDGAAAKSPRGDAGTALSAGGGVRIVIPKWVASGARIDLAVPIHADMRRVEESERRFGPVTPTVRLGSIQPSVGIFQFF